MNLVLPIGSVVRIKGVKGPVMIFGCLQQTALRPGEIMDYVGVPYPIGNLNIQLQMGFQMTAIQEVIFEGYKGKEFEPLEKLLSLRLAQYIVRRELNV